jgi:hypothetical protein
MSPSILCWNAKGCGPDAVYDLTLLLEGGDVHAVLLQETRHLRANFPGWTLFQRRENSDHGGTAILLPSKATARRREDLERKGCDCCVVEVAHEAERMLLASVYRRHEDGQTNWSSVRRVLENLAQSGRPFLAAGDFNSHNKLWGCNKTDSFGYSLGQLCDTHHLTLLNKVHAFGQPTRYAVNAVERDSILDLAITNSPNLFTGMTIDKKGGPSSDHRPITVRVDGSLADDAASLRIVPDVERANWQNYAAQLQGPLTTLRDELRATPNVLGHAEGQECFDRGLSSLLRHINSAAICWVPFKHAGGFSMNRMPGWTSDDDLRELHRSLRDAVHALSHQRDRGEQVYAQLHADVTTARLKLRAAIRKHKAESWRRFTKTAERADRRICWRIFQRSRCRGSRASPYAVMGPDRQLPSSPQQALNNFARHISSICSAPPLRSDHDHQVERDVANLSSQKPPAGKRSDAGFVTLTRVRKARKALDASKAAGPDNVHPSFLKNAPDVIDEVLVELFRLSVAHAYLPASWRSAMVYPLYKGGDKDPATAKAWRPISLTSWLVKLLERCHVLAMVKHAESTGFFLPEQFGFRKGRSTLDQLLQLRHDIASALKTRRSFLPVAFLDIEAAFDSVWTAGLLHKLWHQMRWQGAAWHWIKAFLSGRRFSVIHGDFKSDEHELSAGVPQGSVLSPLLFLCFLNDLPHGDHGQQWRLYVYADDIAIRPAKPGKTGVKQLQRGLNHLTEWSATWHLRFGEGKSNVVIFRLPKSERPVVPPFKLAGFTLKRVAEYRYLGIVLPWNLSWRPHVLDVCAKVERSCQVIARICHFGEAPGVRAIKELMLAIPYAQLGYGLPVWHPETKTSQLELDRKLAIAMRAALGLGSTAHRLGMFIEMDLLPTEIFCAARTLKFGRRTLRLPDNHPSKLLLLEERQALQANRANCPAAKMIRRAEGLLGVSVDGVADIDAAAQAAAFRLFLADEHGSALKVLRSSPGRPVFQDLDTHKVATLRTRLRLNMELVNARRFVFSRGDTEPDCPCDLPDPAIPAKIIAETREHCLMDCPLYADARKLCRDAIVWYGAPWSLQTILGEVPARLSKRRQRAVLRATHDFLQRLWSARRDALITARR